MSKLMMLIVLTLLATRTAFATDVKITWAAPTQATDDKGNIVPFPPGVLTYDVYGGRDTEAPAFRVTTNATSTIRTGVATGNQCYYVIARFAPLEPTPDTWGPSAASETKCVSVVATPSAGPRNLVPIAPSSITVTISVSTP